MYLHLITGCERGYRWQGWAVLWWRWRLLQPRGGVRLRTDDGGPIFPAPSDAKVNGTTKKASRSELRQRRPQVHWHMTGQNNEMWRVSILGLFVSVKVNARGTSSRSLWRCWKSSKWQSRVIWMTRRRPSWWTRGSMTAPSTRPRSRICSINWTRTSVTPAATLGTISASDPRPNPHSNLFSAQARTYYKKVRKTNTRYYVLQTTTLHKHLVFTSFQAKLPDQVMSPRTTTTQNPTVSILYRALLRRRSTTVQKNRYSFSMFHFFGSTIFVILLFFV